MIVCWRVAQLEFRSTTAVVSEHAMYNILICVVVQPWARRGARARRAAACALQIAVRRTAGGSAGREHRQRFIRSRVRRAFVAAARYRIYLP